MKLIRAIKLKVDWPIRNSVQDIVDLLKVFFIIIIINGAAHLLVKFSFDHE